MKGKRVTDYGSGVLGDWKTLGHGFYNPSGKAFADVDLLLVGDSITNRGKEEFVASMKTNHGADVAVNYWSGRPTTPAVDYVLSATTLPPRVIMAVGSNDIMDPSVMAAQIQRVLTNLAARPEPVELWWVDVQASRPAYPVADQRNAGWVNNQIHDAIDPEHVISWFRWFASSPGRIQTYIAADGIHPIEGVGTNFWAEILRQGVAASFG
jgi:hypothetical protein